MQLEIQKSKMSQIESKAESLRMYLRRMNLSDDSDHQVLAVHMDILIELIKEEKKNKEVISDLLNTIANKV